MSKHQALSQIIRGVPNEFGVQADISGASFSPGIITTTCLSARLKHQANKSCLKPKNNSSNVTPAIKAQMELNQVKDLIYRLQFGG